MKNLSIVVVADEDMNEMNIKTADEGFSDFEFSFCIYKVLKQLSKARNNQTAIAAEIFLDEVEK